MTATIRVDEWQAELARVMQRASTREDGAVTAQELVEASGLSRRAVLVRLHALLAQGRLAAVRVQTIDLSGRCTTVPGYRLLPKPKKAAARK